MHLLLPVSNLQTPISMTHHHAAADANTHVMLHCTQIVHKDHPGTRMYLDWILLPREEQREQCVSPHKRCKHELPGSANAVSSCHCEGDQHRQNGLLMYVVSQHEAAAQSTRTSARAASVAAGLANDPDAALLLILEHVLTWCIDVMTCDTALERVELLSMHVPDSFALLIAPMLHMPRSQCQQGSDF